MGLQVEQAGFQEGRSCMEQVWVLQRVLEERARQGQKTFCAFVDVQKAYDRVWRKGLWERLWAAGVKGWLWKMVRSLYVETKSAVRVGGEKSMVFNVWQGVRQGCVLSPVLFNVYIDGLMRELKKLRKGVVVGDEIEIGLEEMPSEVEEEVMHVEEEEMEELREEVAVEDGEGWKCEDCGQAFGTRQGKVVHQARWCVGKREMVRWQCKRLGAERVWVCIECDRVFRSEQGVRVHVEQWCGKVKQGSGVKKREKWVSKGIVSEGSKWKCEGCGKVFESRRGVEVHVRQWCKGKEEVEKSEEVGVLVDGSRLVGLMYADDLAMLAGGAKGCERMLAAVERWSIKWQMRVHVNREVKDKSAVMVVGERADGMKKWEGRWKVYGREVAVTKEYKYLGVWFEARGGWRKMIAERKDECMRRIARVRVWCRKLGLNMNASLVVMRVFVESVLEYGMEMVVMDKRLEKEWEVVKSAGLKSVLGVGQGVSGAVVQELLGEVDVKYKIWGRKLVWLCRLVRMDNCWVSRCLESVQWGGEGRKRDWRKEAEDALGAFGWRREAVLQWTVEECQERVKKRLAEVGEVDRGQRVMRRQRSKRSLGEGGFGKGSCWWIGGLRDDAWWIARRREQRVWG